MLPALLHYNFLNAFNLIAITTNFFSTFHFAKHQNNIIDLGGKILENMEKRMSIYIDVNNGTEWQ